MERELQERCNEAAARIEQAFETLADIFAKNDHGELNGLISPLFPFKALDDLLPEIKAWREHMLERMPNRIQNVMHVADVYFRSIPADTYEWITAQECAYKDRGLNEDLWDIENLVEELDEEDSGRVRPSDEIMLSLLSLKDELGSKECAYIRFTYC